MNCWIVSPNVTKSNQEQEIWKKAIIENEAALMGWGQDDQLGKTFIDDVVPGDIILVAQGANWQKRLLIAGFVSSEARDEQLPETPKSAWYRKLSNCLSKDELEKIGLDFEDGTYGDAKQIPAIYRLKPLTNSTDKIVVEQLLLAINNKRKMQEIESKLALLKYKKQLILQGPPGTGKTKLAKELAIALTGIQETSADHTVLTDDQIVEALQGVHKIPTVAGNVEYDVINVDSIGKTVILRKSTGNEAPIGFERIKELYQIKYWENTIDNNDDRRASAVGWLIYNQRKATQQLNVTDQYKIIQFHPSYSYEDFVRGIVANSTGDKIEYKSVNKILGKFAEEAQKNWDDSHKNVDYISKERKVREYFDRFVDETNEKITENTVIKLTANVNLVGVEADAFRYKGNEGWTAMGNRMLFKDIIQAYIDGNNVRQDITNNKNLSGLAIQHATYFVRVLNMFQQYLESNNLRFDNLRIEKTALKNYVLIIDEINRANLSAVFGELIYALEYRGQAVESMYEIDGDSKLVLPENLYIIGTMNTADRSVAHIDYAMRRRFAFIEVLPKDLTDELGDRFHKVLFEKVAAMFRHDTNLSAEFEPKDVQLGHSYFISNSASGGEMHIKLEYEVKPILLEYVKDGILIGDNIKEVIKNLQA